jgi:hypothetical protein
MRRLLTTRRLAIAVAGAGMLAGAAIGMADGPASPAGLSTMDASSDRQAAGSPADVPPPSAGAPTKPTRITDLSDYRPGPEPASGAEIGPYRVTRYAAENGAIAVTFDPETDVLSVLFPLGAVPPPAPETDMNVSVRIAAFPTAAYDAAADDLRVFATSPDGGRHTYGFGLDAASGLIVVDTDAPAEVTDVIEARHPGLFRFERGEGLRLLDGAGPAPTPR